MANGLAEHNRRPGSTRMRLSYKNCNEVNSAEREEPERRDVIGQIRTRYIADSTVTMVLVGRCTHSRRHVDWEIRASLRQGDVYTPNGLLGVNLAVSRNGCLVAPALRGELER